MKYIRSINESNAKKQMMGLVIRTDVKYNGEYDDYQYQTYHICICYDIRDAVKHIARDIGFDERKIRELNDFCYIENINSKFKNVASDDLSIDIDYWTGFTPSTHSETFVSVSDVNPYYITSEIEKYFSNAKSVMMDRKNVNEDVVGVGEITVSNDISRLIDYAKEDQDKANAIMQKLKINPIILKGLSKLRGLDPK